MRKQYLSTFYLFPKYAFLIRAIIVGQVQTKYSVMDTFIMHVLIKVVQVKL